MHLLIKVVTAQIDTTLDSHPRCFVFIYTYSRCQKVFLLHVIYIHKFLAKIAIVRCSNLGKVLTVIQYVYFISFLNNIYKSLLRFSHYKYYIYYYIYMENTFVSNRVPSTREVTEARSYLQQKWVYSAPHIYNIAANVLLLKHAF